MIVEMVLIHGSYPCTIVTIYNCQTEQEIEVYHTCTNSEKQYHIIFGI